MTPLTRSATSTSCSGNECDDDMLHAFNHPMFVEDLDEGFVMFVGADVAGNLLEIGVVDSADGPIIVHDITARPKYLR